MVKCIWEVEKSLPREDEVWIQEVNVSLIHSPSLLALLATQQANEPGRKGVEVRKRLIGGAG